ncbi:MAG: site-specific DNA-methyltransferase [Chloroflexi bacterium]|nr:site-specific DNA-methyltransferase [Chloroflexota bacterium]
MTNAKVIRGDCLEKLNKDVFRREVGDRQVCLTFLDPPFNQGKDYDYFDDALPESDYWQMMKTICERVRDLTTDGGAIYFMQREKNAEAVLRCLRDSGWTFQNLIIWTKRTSAVPSTIRYGKQYQVIAFATKGNRPRVFNRLRIDLPLRPEHKLPREDGIFVTDVWDDIRELTSGYFAGDEALRQTNGERAHKQQSPVALLLRIILSSTMPGDLVLDPFAGSGTTLVVAEQVGRQSVGIEIDPKNIKIIQERLESQRDSDSVVALREYYRFTQKLREIWLGDPIQVKTPKRQMVLFESKKRYGHRST